MEKNEKSYRESCEYLLREIRFDREFENRKRKFLGFFEMSED